MTHKKQKISKRVHPQQSIGPYYTYIYLSIYIDIYIYWHNQRKIYNEHNCTYTYACTYKHTTHTLYLHTFCIHVVTYMKQKASRRRERERGRGREGEREKERH
jgi:hypothetical protein